MASSKFDLQTLTALSAAGKKATRHLANTISLVCPATSPQTYICKGDISMCPTKSWPSFVESLEVIFRFARRFIAATRIHLRFAPRSSIRLRSLCPEVPGEYLLPSCFSFCLAEIWRQIGSESAPRRLRVSNWSCPPPIVRKAIVRTIFGVGGPHTDASARERMLNLAGRRGTHVATLVTTRAMTSHLRRQSHSAWRGDIDRLERSVDTRLMQRH